jgi:tetratricopeptide (TPR) repeat protein
MDPFVAAERALCRSDLLRALQAYESVSVADARYPDARAAASAVEQRMRRCHELLLDALVLRSETRDAEALDALQRASELWPQQASLRQWIAATEKRMQPSAEPGPEKTSSTHELAEPSQSQLPMISEIGSIGVAALDVGGAEIAASRSSAWSGSPQAVKPSSVEKVKRLAARADPVALGLVAVEVRLGRGELALAVRDLIELSSRFRDDARVNRRLSRLLHQRALMSYGQGSVAAAVIDWRRVLEIDPDNLVVARSLDQALAESRAEKLN